MTGGQVKPALSPPLSIKPPKPAPDSRFVALADLTLTTCRWPLGDPRDEGFRFCGAACDPPYCNSHRRLAYHATHAPIIPPAKLNASNDE
jgi:GcrA cell cycle regulator